jgi:membrane associated rhomboid family serine protease
MTEFRPTRFQILPVVIKNLLIINGLFFLAQNTIGKSLIPMDDLFALHTFQSPLFKPWQFITHLFMHGSIDHILFNMFALWMFGSVLENLWGPKRFLTFYLVCGLGAALAHMTVLFIENQSMINAYYAINPESSDYFFKLQQFIEKYIPVKQSVPVNIQTAKEIIELRLNEATIGASGAVFGCLAAFGYLFPNTSIYIYFFIPIKAKWFVLLYAGFELYTAIANSAGDNVAHVAHLGGALVGFLMVYFWNKNNRKTFY